MAMARIRTIKPEFWSDEKVVDCSIRARLMFIGMWNFADDAGRLEDAPKQIKMKVFPGDDITASDVDELLRELSGIGLVTRYIIENRGYIQINGWRHQVINKPQKSKLPPYSGNTTGELPVGMEWNGKEESPPTPSELEMTVPVAAKVEEGRGIQIDEIRKIIWRLHGKTEDQIGTMLVSTSQEGVSQSRQWIELGLTVEDIRDAASRAYDTSREPIRKPWIYLDAVMRSLDQEDAVPPPDQHIDPMRDKWRQRLKRLKEAGVWFDHFGPKPGEWGCDAPVDLLSEAGLLAVDDCSNHECGEDGDGE